MAGDTILLGTRKGLFTLARGSRGERRVARRAHAGTPVVYAFADARTGTLWASLEHGHWGGKLHRSRDGGATFVEVPAPKYPDGAEIKEGKPATLGYLWVLAPGGPAEPARLYAGTEPGGLFASDDGGETFALVAPLWNHPSRKENWFGGGRDEAGIHSVIVDPRRSERVLVGVSCAGVFETEDGGASWRGRNAGLRADFLPDPRAEFGHDPHCLVACAAEPDVLWQQNHCGVFRSVDGARSWTEVSQPRERGPVRFGFPIAADARDPETAWVVPLVSDQERFAVDGALCVGRTTDGGKTWDALRRGLPQEDCYDVVYRHALDARGDRLAFGSTTGNVFVSEDRGESWRTLGNHFPPVYSVRFAD